MQRIAVVNYRALSPTETFIRDQVNHLPFEVSLIHRENPELCELPPPTSPLPTTRRSEKLVERYVELLEGLKVAQVKPIDPTNKAKPFGIKSIRVLRKRDHEYKAEKIQ